MKMNTIKKRLPNENSSVSKGHTREIYAIALSDDSKFLASAGVDRSVKIWNPETLEFIYSFEGHRDAVTVKIESNYFFKFRLD